jgi:dTDP-4-amino-4,6-dideoxygalactose transaminase
LAQAGIGTLIHYPVPPHLSPAYAAENRFQPGDFPLTEQLAATVLSLPLGPHMQPGQVAEVAESIRRFCEA